MSKQVVKNAKQAEVEKARKVLLAEQMEKDKKCAEEINEVLKKYGRTIDVVSQIRILPK